MQHPPVDKDIGALTRRGNGNTLTLTFLDCQAETPVWLSLYPEAPPQYPEALQPSINVLTTMCTAMIESIYDPGIVCPSACRALAPSFTAKLAL